MMVRFSLLILVTIFLLAGSPNAQVLITEFLCDPQAPLETEWVELFNGSGEVVDLNNWSVCDLVDCAKIGAVSIAPGQYLLLVQDRDAFLVFYPGESIAVVEITGWQVLNNAGDLIRLENQMGQTVDSLSYLSGNGGNISWERISFARPGYEFDNWHPSLDSTGSTPGALNSVAGGFADEFGFELPDRLFSPGCACPDENLIMEIALPRDCRLTLSVFSIEGLLLRKIYEDRLLVSGQYIFDGRDQDGQFLDIGLYVMLAEGSGSCAQSKKIVFGVAK